MSGSTGIEKWASGPRFSYNIFPRMFLYYYFIENKTLLFYKGERKVYSFPVAFHF
jgi:hypothetical protein